MTEAPPQDGVGATATLDRELASLLEAAGLRTTDRLRRDLITTALALATDHVDRLDLKIATAALAEMRDAFRVFAPYEHVSKVTIFGSARTQPEDPLYDQARRVAHLLA